MPESCHLISTLPGKAGSAELKRFVTAIGLRRKRLQDEGTYREHYDLFAEQIDAARDGGARLVTHAQLGRLLRAKSQGRAGAVE